MDAYSMTTTQLWLKSELEKAGYVVLPKDRFGTVRAQHTTAYWTHLVANEDGKFERYVHACLGRSIGYELMFSGMLPVIQETLPMSEGVRFRTELTIMKPETKDGSNVQDR